MPSVRWARELADLVALEASLTWTRLLLWLNVLVLVPLALSAYPASPELLDPAARLRSLGAVRVAAVISSQAFHVLVAVTCSISWARALERGVLRNVLTLPVSRRSAFAAKFLTSVSIPTAAYVGAHALAQLYTLPSVGPADVAVMALVVLLRAAFLGSLSTLAALLVKDSVSSLFLSVALAELVDHVGEEFDLKWLGRDYYDLALSSIYSADAAGAATAVLPMLAASLAALAASLAYFSRMDLD